MVQESLARIWRRIEEETAMKTARAGSCEKTLLAVLGYVEFATGLDFTGIDMSVRQWAVMKRELEGEVFVLEQPGEPDERVRKQRCFMFQRWQICENEGMPDDVWAIYRRYQDANGEDRITWCCETVLMANGAAR